MYFSPPAKITGKWNKKTYEIVRPLGQGANGHVFLVKYKQQNYALKIGNNPVDLMPEINILQVLQQAQGISLGPALHDVDDVWWNGNWTGFYVMDWVEGETLRQYIKDRHGMGLADAIPIISAILTALGELHKMGYCYGDIKPENIMMTAKTSLPCIIDFGGVTLFGRSIREYTEEYDRGAWGAGLRKAEPSYDLYAVGVMLLEMLLGTQQWKKEIKSSRNLSLLYGIIRKQKKLRPIHSFFYKTFTGKYTTALAMKNDLLRLNSSVDQSAPNQWIQVMFVCSCILLGISLAIHI